jgi:hypothetical protein
MAEMSSLVTGNWCSTVVFSASEEGTDDELKHKLARPSGRDNGKAWVAFPQREYKRRQWPGRVMVPMVVDGMDDLIGWLCLVGVVISETWLANK